MFICLGKKKKKSSSRLKFRIDY